MIRPDLHMHSTLSDGVLTPCQLVQECMEAGLTVMAITDHDTFQGSDALLALRTPLRVIPGVQLSIADMRGLHLLGYGLTAAPQLRETVATLAQKRSERAKTILQRLHGLGMPLDLHDLQSRCSGTIGRPHIARAMVHMGYVSCMQEAFEKYIGHGKPAYASSERLSMRDALPMLRRNGFVPVLAHPYELKLQLHLMEPLIEQWKAQGLLGIEVYHPSAAAHGFTQLDHLARRHDLLVTGGSDFHQANDKHGKIGSTVDDWLSAADDMARLEEALQKEIR